ncbi:MAG: hypothetical protein ACYCX2_02655 [Christensenellales bacterium]
MDMTDYLLSGEDWLQYAVRASLLGESREGLEEVRARALEDPKIRGYLQDVANYHGAVVSTHKNPGLSVNKLLFLLDLGLDTDVFEIRTAVDEIQKHKDGRGVYQSLVNIPKHFGGTGENTFGWSLCDAPLLLLALTKAGVSYGEHIKKGVDYLAFLFQNGAFPCVGSDEIGKFRGPGRKEDCCPFATLAMLRLFNATEEYWESPMAKMCAETLLSLWENSLELHPYMFYMGTDFRKLKAPPVWYDLIGVLDCLSGTQSVLGDRRFLEMLSVLENKRDENGLYTPESVYLKCKDWDFGQKKEPSAYLTFLCARILKRAGRA